MLCEPQKESLSPDFSRSFPSLHLPGSKPTGAPCRGCPCKVCGCRAYGLTQKPQEGTCQTLMSDSLVLPGELAPGGKEMKRLIMGTKEEGRAGATQGGPGGGGAWRRRISGSRSDRSDPVHCHPGSGPEPGGWPARQAPSSLCLSGEGAGEWRAGPCPVVACRPPWSITETYLPSLLQESPPPLGLLLPSAGEAGVFPHGITWPDPSLRSRPPFFLE